ncbi:MAG: DUF3098 domain-containing protein [Bacteroidales bacterium]
MFSFRRVVVGPNMCFIGYILMIAGILIKDKRNGTTEE